MGVKIISDSILQNGHPAMKLQLNYPSDQQQLSVDGKLLVEWVSDGFTTAPTYVWDIETQQQTAMLSGHTRSINNIFMSSDNRLLALGSGDGSLYLWRLKTPYPGILCIGHRLHADGGDENCWTLRFARYCAKSLTNVVRMPAATST